MLECVVNISEGTDPVLIERLRSAAHPALLDLHSDRDHNRSVFTMAGPPDQLDAAVRTLARTGVELLDVTTHRGVHPRIGVLDVVPWVDLADPEAAATPASLAARDSFATWAGAELELPCFLYGPDRSLPEVRRSAWSVLRPDRGPSHPHPTAGASAVGARGLLVAYNLWLRSDRLADARAVAASVRGPHLRALGLVVAGRAQVSCNLIRPAVVGPAEAHAAVSSFARIDRAELVGLLPLSVLRQIPAARWAELGLSLEQTIEARLSR